jgi:hypothetical protein
MKRTIALWASAGFIVACAWVVFFAVTAPHPYSEHTFWMVVDITAPASLLRAYPVKFYWFILLNAFAYAVVGFGTGMFRRAPASRS